MTNVNEVSPPGWGHTKAEKEKTKPNKPKSKIGGSAHEFDKDLKSGKFKGLPGDKTMKDKKASMFKLMWSMKNKGDKPHYKPGVKDVLKKKYQKEEKADEKPYPPTRLFKNVPNSVVKKANKEADKVKREQEKAVLGEPPVRGPSGDSMHSKDNVYEDSLIAQAIAELSKKTMGSYVKKASVDKSQAGIALGQTSTGNQSQADVRKHVGKMIKRQKGIGKAVDKLSKEDWQADQKQKERDALIKAVAKSPKQQELAKKQKKEDFGLPPATVADKDLGDKINKAHDKEQKRRAKIDAKNIKVHGKLPYKKEDMSLAPKGKGRKAAKALYKEWEEVEMDEKYTEAQRTAREKSRGKIHGAHPAQLGSSDSGRQWRKHAGQPSRWGHEGERGKKKVKGYVPFNSPRTVTSKDRAAMSRRRRRHEEVEIYEASKKLWKSVKATDTVFDVVNNQNKYGSYGEIAVSGWIAKQLGVKNPDGDHYIYFDDADLVVGERGDTAVRGVLSSRKPIKMGDLLKKAQAFVKKKKPVLEEVTHFGDVLRQAIAEAKKVDAIKEINKIVKTKTMGKLHGQKVDLFTASAIQQVYKAINHKNKEKMNSVMSKDIHGLLKMADFSMSKMKR